MRAYILIIVALLMSCSGNESKKNGLDSDTTKNESPDSIQPISTIDRENSWIPFSSKYSFDSFLAKRYSGKLATPDFSTVEYGSDRKFQEFMSERINNVSINFAGKYTIIEKSCGTMCVAIYVIDRKTGKIFDYFPPEGDGRWGYSYRSNSCLLVANSGLLNDSMTKFMNGWNMEPEFYHWTGKAFNLLR